MAPPSAPYSVTKIAEEGVARYCARSFELPTTIAPMGAAYSDQSGLPVWHLDAIAAGEPVHTRWDPMTYSPIHDDDICAHLEPLLDAATVPATIVNWAGDEPVSVQRVLGVLRRSSGRRPEVVVTEIPGASVGSVADHTAHRDHGSVHGRVARRLPPRRRALLSRPDPGSLTRGRARPTPTRCSPTRSSRPASTTSAPGSTFCSAVGRYRDRLRRDGEADWLIRELAVVSMAKSGAPSR